MRARNLTANKDRVARTHSSIHFQLTSTIPEWHLQRNSNRQVHSCSNALTCTKIGAHTHTHTHIYTHTHTHTHIHTHTHNAHTQCTHTHTHLGSRQTELMLLNWVYLACVYPSFPPTCTHHIVSNPKIHLGGVYGTVDFTAEAAVQYRYANVLNYAWDGTTYEQ